MTNTLPVYLVDRIPGAEGRTVEWISICHEHKKVFVCYEETRWVSRHIAASRSRKFCVYYGNFARPLSAHFTLAAAQKSAEKFAKEFA